jgi:hypothetical protein
VNGRNARDGADRKATDRGTRRIDRNILVGGRGDNPERIAQEVKTKQEEGEGERPSAASARFLGVETADSRHLTNPCH